MRTRLLLALLLTAAPFLTAFPLRADAPILRDATEEVGLRFTYENGMRGEFWYPENFGGGVAFVDYDNDGDLDVYLVQGVGTDRLLRNDLRPEGPRFVDVTERAGLGVDPRDGKTYGMGVIAGDADGDGNVDLYITRFGSNRLLRSRGDGTFEDITATSGTDDPRWSVPAVFFDFDGDGRLDLYVGNYVDFSFAAHRACFSESGLHDYCKPLVYEAVPDRLLRNLGNDAAGVPRFADVTSSSGLRAAYGRALGAVSADFNGDGRLDLYVANDASENQLWIGQKDGTFLDDALFAGCALNREGAAEGSMGVDARDFDRDGDEDLFMTHPAGETNTLYENDGSGLFTDQTLERGLSTGLTSTGFGMAWTDLDNDGRLDLFVANGAVQAIEAQRRAGEEYPYRQADQLFTWQEAAGRYAEVGGGIAELEATVGRGVTHGDLDLDGDVDLLISANQGPARLLLNEGEQGHWLSVRLPDGGSFLLRGTLHRIRTEGSYASSVSPAGWVGLGENAVPGDLEIRRPDGARRLVRGLRGDIRVLVRR